MKRSNKLNVNPDGTKLWVIIITMLAFGLQVSKVEAQQVRIGSGVHFVNGVQVSTGSLVNHGTLENNAAGVMKLTGNWQNDGDFTGVTGSTVAFRGSSSQLIGGTNQTTFSNLTLNNSSGCTLACGVKVKDTLDFQSGLLTTGADTLKMGPFGIIIHADASKYINGKLAWTFDAIGSRVFPVGKAGVYRPVSFQYTGLTGTSVVTVEQMETALTGTLPVNTYLLTTNRYWNIGQQGGSNLQYFLTLDSTGTSPVNPVVLLKKDGSLVSSFPTSTPNYTNAAVLSSFSDFALGEQCPVHTISGFAKYDNNPLTWLNGLKVILKQNDVAIDSVITSTNGFYQFNNVNNGNYGLVVKSAHPSGQWQTWGGVNMTDYLLAQKHATTGPLLPATPPVMRIAGDVKAPQTPPVITTVDATAIQMAAKYGWGNPPWFQIPKWVFSGVDQASRIDTFALACANVTRDIRGLCAGDVNGTYLPSNGYKMAEPSMELVNLGTIPVTNEMTFPVRLVETTHALSLQQTIGAITLMLDYDPTMIEITGVEMPENGGNEPWFEVQSSRFEVQGSRFKVEGATNLEPRTLNLLSIGWASLNPIYVAEGGTVLLIHARLKEDFRISHFTFGVSDLKYQISNAKPEMRNVKGEIRFTLNTNPISELADGNGNVLSDSRLSMADAGFQVPDSRFSEEAGVVVYPNPAHETLNLELVTPLDGTTLNLELVNLQGVSVMKNDLGIVTAGWHREQLNLRDLSPGAYFLRVTMGEETIVKKVVVRNR